MDYPFLPICPSKEYSLKVSQKRDELRVKIDEINSFKSGTPLSSSLVKQKITDLSVYFAYSIEKCYKNCADLCLDFLDEIWSFQYRSTFETNQSSLEEIISELTEHFAIMVTSNSCLPQFRTEFFQKWQKIVSGISKETLCNVVLEMTSTLKVIADTVFSIGHFRTQLRGFHLLMNYIESCDDELKEQVILDIFPSRKFESIREMIIDYDGKKENVASIGRKILNKFNMETCTDKNVTSLLVKGGNFGSFLIQGTEKNEFWIDFNHSTKTISFECESSCFSKRNSGSVYIELFPSQILLLKEEQAVSIKSNCIPLLEPFLKTLTFLRTLKFFFNESDSKELNFIVEKFSQDQMEDNESVATKSSFTGYKTYRDGHNFADGPSSPPFKTNVTSRKRKCTSMETTNDSSNAKEKEVEILGKAPKICRTYNKEEKPCTKIRDYPLRSRNSIPEDTINQEKKVCKTYNNVVETSSLKTINEMDTSTVEVVSSKNIQAKIQEDSNTATPIAAEISKNTLCLSNNINNKFVKPHQICSKSNSSESKAVSQRENCSLKSIISFNKSMDINHERRKRFITHSKNEKNVSTSIFDELKEGPSSKTYSLRQNVAKSQITGRKRQAETKRPTIGKDANVKRKKVNNSTLKENPNTSSVGSVGSLAADAKHKTLKPTNFKSLKTAKLEPMRISLPRATKPKTFQVFSDSEDDNDKLNTRVSRGVKLPLKTSQNENFNDGLSEDTSTANKINVANNSKRIPRTQEDEVHQTVCSKFVNTSCIAEHPLHVESLNYATGGLTSNCQHNRSKVYSGWFLDRYFDDMFKNEQSQDDLFKDVVTSADKNDNKSLKTKSFPDENESSHKSSHFNDDNIDQESYFDDEATSFDEIRSNHQEMNIDEGKNTNRNINFTLTKNKEIEIIRCTYNVRKSTSENTFIRNQISREEKTSLQQEEPHSKTSKDSFIADMLIEKFKNDMETKYREVMRSVENQFVNEEIFSLISNILRSYYKPYIHYKRMSMITYGKIKDLQSQLATEYNFMINTLKSSQLQWEKMSTALRNIQRENTTLEKNKRDNFKHFINNLTAECNESLQKHWQNYISNFATSIYENIKKHSSI